MARETALTPKARRGSGVAGSAKAPAAAKPRGMAKGSGSGSRARVGRSLTPAAPAFSKEELKLRVEKLERANATLRVKNKELRVAYVEAAEQLDSLTLRLQSMERRAERQARQEEGGQAPGARGGRGERGARPRANHVAGTDQNSAEGIG